MARRQTRVAGGESAAFEKLTAALRHAIEGATELGVLQQRQQWTAVATAMQRTLAMVNELHMTARIKVN